MDPSTQASNSDNLIHFAGPWTQEEIRLVRSAVQDVELTSPMSEKALTQPPLPVPWVATCSRDEEWTVFGATRFKLPEVFAADTATALADQIREAGSGTSTSFQHP